MLKEKNFQQKIKYFIKIIYWKNILNNFLYFFFKDSKKIKKLEKPVAKSDKKNYKE